jgi:tetratricopeptide (TPR) repeat protein
LEGAHLHLGRLCQLAGKRDEAIAHLRNEYLLQGEDCDILLDLSNLLLDTGQMQLAIQCLRRLSALAPDNADAWQNLAVAHFMGKSYQEGVEASRQALRCDGRHLMAMHNLAVAYERLGHYEQALRWVRTALEIEPRDAIFAKLEMRLGLLKLRARAAKALRWLLRRPRRGPVALSYPLELPTMSQAKGAGASEGGSSAPDASASAPPLGASRDGSTRGVTSDDDASDDGARDGGPSVDGPANGEAPDAA